MATWHVVSSDPLRSPSAPPEQRVTVAVNIRLVVVFPLGCAKENELALKNTGGSIALLCKQIDRPYGDMFQESRRLKPAIKKIAEQSHSQFRPEITGVLPDQVGGEILRFFRGFAHNHHGALKNAETITLIDHRGETAEALVGEAPGNFLGDNIGRVDQCHHANRFTLA
ncbi:MAG: hypothetical protein ACXWOV_16765, partial [Isosphaeraceae bacterium]